MAKYVKPEALVIEFAYENIASGSVVTPGRPGIPGADDDTSGDING